jgi:hypothetical protein
VIDALCSLPHVARVGRQHLVVRTCRTLEFLPRSDLMIFKIKISPLLFW